MKANGRHLRWCLSNDERALIAQIAARFCSEFPGILTRVHVEMDVAATHLNGCALDLAGLSTSNPFDLLHDVTGICSHLDRQTGQLGDCFLPRCARKTSAQLGLPYNPRLRSQTAFRRVVRELRKGVQS